MSSEEAEKFPLGFDKGICPECKKECKKIGSSNDQWTDLFQCECGKQYGYTPTDMGQTLPSLFEVKIILSKKP